MSLYYEDDFVTLYHGDCLTEHREWLGADVLVTDPPYGYSVKMSRGNGKSARDGYSPWVGTEIANDSDLTARSDVLAAWGDRPAIAFGSWKRPKPESTHTVLIWDKGEAAGMGDLAIPWKPNWEEIYVMGKGYKGHRGSSILTGHTVISWASKGREHPNMKPISLMERLIEKCPAGVIADPFAGSGATLIAAKALGRMVIGVELEEKYCEVIAKRCAQDVFDFGGAA